MNKEIELSKSWFELAKILATIAGFLMVAAGIILSYSSNMLLASTQILGGTNLEEVSSISLKGPICETFDIPFMMKASPWFFWISLSFGILSIFFWFVGWYKLKAKNRGISLGGK